MNLLFAVWNLDRADHSMFLVALRSQIFRERPASWTFGSMRPPLLLVGNVLSACCLLAMTRRLCFSIGLPLVSPSGLLAPQLHVSETGSGQAHDHAPARGACAAPTIATSSRARSALLRSRAPGRILSVQSRGFQHPLASAQRSQARWCVRQLPHRHEHHQRQHHRQRQPLPPSRSAFSCISNCPRGGVASCPYVHVIHTSNEFALAPKWMRIEALI
jgi:hypothetical protein